MPARTSKVLYARAAPRKARHPRPHSLRRNAPRQGLCIRARLQSLPKTTQKRKGLQPLREAVARSATTVEASSFRPRNTASPIHAPSGAEYLRQCRHEPRRSSTPWQPRAKRDTLGPTAYKKALRDTGFVSGHDFSRAENIARRKGLQPLREAVAQSATTVEASSFTACEKTLRDRGFVSWHDFSRAENNAKGKGLQPLREAAAQSATMVEASAFRPRNTASPIHAPSGAEYLRQCRHEPRRSSTPGQPRAKRDTLGPTAYKKALRDTGFVSGHDFSRAENIARRKGLQPLREAVAQSATTVEASSFTACEKTLRDRGSGSGHAFTRAATARK